MRTAMWVAGSNRSQAGFTLLEILLVLVIATLLLGLVAPRLVAVLPGVELKTGAQQIAALLRQARSQAITENRTVSLIYEAEQRSVKLPGESRLLSWPEAVQITWQPAARGLPESEGNTISFFPDGSSSGGSVALASGLQRYEISVHWLTGRIMIGEGQDER
ncbi:GspH/FimT family pseudopilin [Amphritea balenae]|uniref:GspH/FimT family pseudopilin n=1 Tax=Amphritea balenae TaxID=452629 RepID=UPI001475A1F9|nr:GspH/FimT family pseudopilin [Amphritea balenae]